VTTEQYQIGYEAGYSDGFDAGAAQQAEQTGWVRVPVEPDETMESCGDMVLSCGAKDVYKAMLAAAPKGGAL